MIIRSNPPGAMVYIDDYEIGTTPVSTQFTYYGQRKIRLIKDGCETLTVMQRVPPPWYQIPPIDFVAENLIPGELRDERTLTYQMTPQKVLPTDQLLGRAEELRSRAHNGGSLGAAPAGLAPTINPPAPGSYVAPPATPGNYRTPSLQPSGGVPVHALPPGGQPAPFGP